MLRTLMSIRCAALALSAFEDQLRFGDCTSVTPAQVATLERQVVVADPGQTRMGAYVHTGLALMGLAGTLLATGSFFAIPLLAEFGKPFSCSGAVYSLVAGLVVASVDAAIAGIFRFGQVQASRVRHTLRPMADDATACERALEYVRKSPACRQLRDAVVARGEELRQFHMEMMHGLAQADADRDAKAKARETCKQLHGLTDRELLAVAA